LTFLLITHLINRFVALNYVIYLIKLQTQKRPTRSDGRKIVNNG
jgi:hypothetical protein